MRPDERDAYAGDGEIVRMPSPDDMTGASVVRLRAEPQTELGPVSPELALVDPELAHAARELLRDAPQSAAVGMREVVAPAPSEESPWVERPPRRLEPAPAPAPTLPRRRGRLRLLASASGVLALGVLLTLVVGREERETPSARQAQSVAAAVSPPSATVTRPERTSTAPAAPAATSPAKPARTSPAPTTSPPVHAAAVPGQTFVWVASPDAAAYEFQLFQGDERIFRARVDEARLELPGRWRQDGRPHALLPGNYRWYVWTISKSTNRQSTKPTVSAKLVVDDEPQ